MSWTTIIDYVTKAFTFIKENINKVYIAIIYLKERKIKDLEKVNEALTKENENTRNNIKEKERLDKITKNTQNKIKDIKKPTKTILIVLCILFLSSCTTTKIIYRTDVIKASLPEIFWCGDSALSLNGEQPITEKEKEYWLSCLSYYEKEIKEYNDYVVEYYKEVEAEKK